MASFSNHLSSYVHQMKLHSTQIKWGKRNTLHFNESIHLDGKNRHEIELDCIVLLNYRGTESYDKEKLKKKYGSNSSNTYTRVSNTKHAYAHQSKQFQNEMVTKTHTLRKIIKWESAISRRNNTIKKKQTNTAIGTHSRYIVTKMFVFEEAKN